MNENEQTVVNGYSAVFAPLDAANVVSGKLNELDECVKKIHTMNAVVDMDSGIPTRAHETDAGLDLYAKEGGWILPKSRKVFDTGFHCAIPKGYVGMLTSKSGLMLRGITSRGTIDSGYTGSIKAVLFNHSWLPVKINKWQKISQLVIMPIVTPRVKLVDSLEQTERSNGGFGSTGKF